MRIENAKRAEVRFPYGGETVCWEFDIVHRGKRETFIMERGPGYVSGPGHEDVVLATLNCLAGDADMAYDLHDYPDVKRGVDPEETYDGTVTREEAVALAAIGQEYYDKLERLGLLQED